RRWPRRRESLRRPKGPGPRARSRFGLASVALTGARCSKCSIEDRPHGLDIGLLLFRVVGEHGQHVQRLAASLCGQLQIAGPEDNKTKTTGDSSSLTSDLVVLSDNKKTEKL
ncbi:MAG: hypothetical protein P8Y04_13595, partial [Desulfobulbaceae bacterium]